MNNEIITIPLSKQKISLLIGLGLVMTAVALWLIVAYDGEWSRMSQTAGKIAGFVGVVFFAAATVFGFIKLLDKRPDLTYYPGGNCR